MPMDVDYRAEMTYLSSDSLSRLVLRNMVQYSGNKWSQILKLLIIKGVKLPRKKNFFLANFDLLARNYSIKVTKSDARVCDV